MTTGLMVASRAPVCSALKDADVTAGLKFKHSGNAGFAKLGIQINFYPAPVETATGTAGLITLEPSRLLCPELLFIYPDKGCASFRGNNRGLSKFSDYP